MKKYIYSIIVIFTVSFFSCNEDRILEEIPKDFLSPENAYTEPEHIESAIHNLHNRTREFWVQRQRNGSNLDLYRKTDVSLERGNLENNSNYSIHVIPTNGEITRRWTLSYEIIFHANTIINRIDNVNYPSDDEKNAHLAEAMFFRALFYRFLGHLFGGVPIVLEETNSPRRDFVRDSRENVYLQCKSDLEFAVANLPGTDDVAEPGRICNAAASHLLAEIYISLGEYQKAIDEASKVIDGGDFSLMTERFGSRVNEPGDVYWDLFRMENQNRPLNREGIWVIQIEYKTPGGLGEPEINHQAPYYTRLFGPSYQNLRAKDGKSMFESQSTYHGGRGGGYALPTTYVRHGVWTKSDWNDMRNSKYNVLRKYYIDNPDTQFFGDTLDLTDPDYVSKYLRNFDPNDSGNTPIRSDTLQHMSPYFLKATQINNHFEEFLVDGGPFLTSFGGRNYQDVYAFRLAETYLLRAEAYLANGQTQEAADDINMLRNRAEATPVTAAEVDIDYILDERIRELFIEELRRVTLHRLGKLYDRVKMYNPWSAPSIEPFNNLYPIPFSEIERNTLGNLEQNPGYSN